jgi:hypothetical protein
MHDLFSSRAGIVIVLIAAAILAVPLSSRAQIVAGQVDTFQDGSTQHWSGSSPENVADAGPNGTGDNALFITAHGFQGPGGKLLAYNDGFQWDGNWTAAGVAQIAMDVRNPNQYPLMMRIGIAGPDGFGGGGSLDTHVSTSPISVPADNAWHSITFPATAADFTTMNEPFNVAAALAGVSHFRILHNPQIAFVGATVNGSFYVDNIRALAAAEPPTGDYNGNGTVDAADYVVWRKMLNQSVTPGSGADGTGPGGTPDGVVNDLDYSFWRSQFGSTSAAAGTASNAAAVPEPATLTLLLFLISAIVRRHR